MSIQKHISNYYKMLIERSRVKYVREVLIGTGVLLTLAAGFALRSYYIDQREKKAFTALVDVAESYEKSQREMLSASKKSDEEKENIWQDTKVLSEALYQQNIGSYLAPYFLMYKAQVDLELGEDIDKVRSIIESGLQQIPKTTPLYTFFNLKRIKMALDSTDQTVRETALSDLIKLAKDEKGYSFEEASFLLGSYYLFLGDIYQARETFKNLLKQIDKTSLISSPWVKQAEEKLTTIENI